MKTVKCATLDKKYVDYLSISEKDGKEIIVYATGRILINNPCITGETAEYDVPDDKIDEHVRGILGRNPGLVRIRIGL